MYCSNCGVQVTDQASFCSSCGRPTGATVTPAPTIPTTPAQAPMLPPYQRVQKTNSGLGLGITSIIIGVLTLGYAFTDWQGVSSGMYGYIYYSEIGLLLMMSAVGIVFGSISTKAENGAGKAGLGISLLALLFTFFLAQFGG